MPGKAQAVAQGFHGRGDFSQVFGDQGQIRPVLLFKCVEKSQPRARLPAALDRRRLGRPESPNSVSKPRKWSMRSTSTSCSRWPMRAVHQAWWPG